MATTSQDTIMEEREELMVPPKLTKHHNPTRKIARFLKPSATSIDVQPFPFNLPTVSSSPETVSFSGWRTPPKNWKSWVRRMHFRHQSTWKNAGIEQAVLNSSYEITKNDDLVLGFARKWCHETKTFAFIWGEATITLEDMMVLGGYSVLGESVLTPVENVESKIVLDKLVKARAELTKSTYKKADQLKWMKKFKDSRSEIEHEAFRVLWLSRFVFPSSLDRDVFPIAVRLARGVKLALAPAILATIYKDLSFLKATLFDYDNSNYSSDDDETSIKVWAPLQLVKIWIWERFPKLSPIVGDTCNSKPRFAKWNKKNVEMENDGGFLDSDTEDFCWRPYATDESDDLGRWVVLCDGLDEEMESWARCLRASELVGIKERCIEQYLPHRVAMQFGMDQDIPGDVARNNLSWRCYTRLVTDAKLYLPPRISEPCVTVRYLEWRNKSTGKKDESREERCKESVGLKLVARIKRLEEVFGYFKAKRFRHK